MRSLLGKALAIVSITAGVSTWVSASSAQETTSPATTPTTTEPETPPMRSSTPAQSSAPAQTTAPTQTVNVQQPAPQVGTTQTTATVLPVAARDETIEAGEKVPNGPLIFTGLVVFGVPWVASTIVSSSSDHQGDGHLWVPLAGPWMDLADRGGLPSDSSGHDTEVTNRVLLGIDGVFQAVGALQILGGFVFPVEKYERKSTAATKPELRLTPMKVGKTGYGFGAVGTF